MGLGGMIMSNSSIPAETSNTKIGGLKGGRAFINTCVETPTRTGGNPDPKNWKVLRASEHGKFLIVGLKYPDCTNYEGAKLLVFEGLTLKKLLKQKLVDPHFFESGKKYKSPIARFEPTERGWKMAERFVRAMTGPGVIDTIG
jgi:hypothetical protein